MNYHDCRQEDGLDLSKHFAGAFLAGKNRFSFQKKGAEMFMLSMRFIQRT